MGIMTIPVFFPLLAKQFDVSGILVGLVLAMSPIVTILSVPFINKFIQVVGVEATIFTSGIIFGFSFILLAFASWI